MALQAPESLDPHTLRLLWKQWELEIQALRWAVQNHQDARRCRILQEVAGLPPERSAGRCWSPGPHPSLSPVPNSWFMSDSNLNLRT